MTASAMVGAPRRRLLGTNPSLMVFTGLFVFAAYVFAWGWLSAPPNEVSNVLDVGSMLAVCVAFVFVVGTNRVVGAPRVMWSW